MKIQEHDVGDWRLLYIEREDLRACGGYILNGRLGHIFYFAWKILDT